jgi:hypothetical protein
VGADWSGEGGWELVVVGEWLCPRVYGKTGEWV